MNRPIKLIVAILLFTSVPFSAFATTYTINPDSTHVDGRALITSAGSWSAAVNGNGNFSDYNTATLQLYSSFVDKRIDRPILQFDTSSIPAGETVVSATLSIYGQSISSQGGLNMAVNITQANPASLTAIANSDYEATTPFTTKLSTDLAYASIATGAYNDFVLNASGLAAINKGGTSKFSVRFVNDITNTDPGSGTDENFLFYGYSNGSNKPKLVVVTTSGGGGTTAAPKQDLILFN